MQAKLVYISLFRSFKTLSLLKYACSNWDGLKKKKKKLWIKIREVNGSQSVSVLHWTKWIISSSSDEILVLWNSTVCGSWGVKLGVSRRRNQSHKEMLLLECKKVQITRKQAVQSEHFLSVSQIAAFLPIRRLCCPDSKLLLKFCIRCYKLTSYLMLNQGAVEQQL